MMEKLRVLALARREQLTYLVVGMMTTAINYAVYALATLAGVHYIAGNVAAWVMAVLFAYLANGRWVYRSTARRGWREAAAFALSRLFSLGLETLCLLLLVDWLRVERLAAKPLVTVLVVVTNYFTGLFVFKRGKKS